MLQHNYINEEIKNLTPWEVFDFFDGPRFYSCKSKSGQIYVVYWVDESNGCDLWLYTRVSFERYCALKNAKVSIASIFNNSEENFSFLVSVLSESEFTTEVIKAELFDEDWLPDEDEFLEIDSCSTTLPQKIVDIQESAIANSRQVVDLAFERITNSFEIASENLGKILSTAQNFLYASACPNNIDIRRVPDNVKEDNTLMVTGLFASSFGVRLQSKNSDLFEDSPHNQNLNNFIDLLNASQNSENLLPKLKALNLLSRSRFKALLKELVSAGVSVKAEWADPFGKFSSSMISFESLKESLRKLEEGDDSNTQTIKYENVRLVGVDIENDFFALFDRDGNLIKGKLESKLESYSFNVPSMISATIEETCIINPVTDKEKWSYKLIDVQSA